MEDYEKVIFDAYLNIEEAINYLQSAKKNINLIYEKLRDEEDGNKKIESLDEIV